MTVRLVNVPSAPVIPDAAFSVNSSYVGPLADGGAMTYNRNRYPLKFQIIGGNPTPPLFAIDARRGNVSVIAPGPIWTAFLHSYTLTIKVEADGVAAAIPLESTATWTVEVLHLNGKPVWQPASGPTFYVNEADIAVGAAVGTLSAVDTDMEDPTCDPAWYNVTYTLQSTGSWRGTNNIFAVDAARLVWANVPPFDPVLDYTWYGRFKVRGTFSLPALACDNAAPALCSNATVVVAVLSVNATGALPIIADVYVPAGGMKTDGTSVITLVGSDFPTGGSLVLSYKNELGLLFNARNCVIKSASWAECIAGEWETRSAMLFPCVEQRLCVMLVCVLCLPWSCSSGIRRRLRHHGDHGWPAAQRLRYHAHCVCGTHHHERHHPAADFHDCRRRGRPYPRQ